MQRPHGRNDCLNHHPHRCSNTGVHFTRNCMASLQELLDQKSAIEREITRTRQESRARAVAQILAIMSENALTIEDLAKSHPPGKKPRETSRKPVAAKYRDPQSGSTWSGRGLKPRWLAAAIDAGKSIGDFAV